MDVVGDRYELGRTLGAGGMARVVEAHDRVLDRKVAVKLLRDDIATDPAVRDRFLREARTAARFTHRNAVTVYDTGQDGRQPWIVMELVHGRDLAQHLGADGALEEGEAVRIADGVLAALAAAHRDGMVHRDVKPGNIMLLDDGGVKLADFGIAKSVQDATAGLTQTGQIIGTAKYLSPEQVEGLSATPASDVYATGVVLYEMLTGDPPFTGDSAIAVALAHTRDPVPDLGRAAPGVSPHVAGVVERSLAKDPAQRYRDAGEMRRALGGEAVGAAAATTAVMTDEPAATRALAPRRQSRAPWLLIALILLALLVAAALAALSQQTPEETTVAPTDAPADAQPADEAPAEDAPEEEPPAEEAPEEEPPPDPEPIAPTDIPSLIELLEANPGAYGPRQQDLSRELQKVLDREGDQQADAASQLQERIAQWAESGELDSDIAQIAFDFLEPLTAEEGGGPPDNRGRGEGRGQDGDDDDDD